MTCLTVYTKEQVIALEQQALQKYKMTDLMQRAGKAAFKCLIDTYPEVKSITVLCGKGNNGGDGLVVATQAKLAGYQVEVLLLAKAVGLQGDAKDAYQQAVAAEVSILDCKDKIPTLNGEILVDAILGTGSRGEISGIYSEAIAKMNLSGKVIYAIDIPSGLNANTGEVNSIVVYADKTVTFIGIKQGLLLQEGPGCVGELDCFSLELPQELYKQMNAQAQVFEPSTLLDLLPYRERGSHKGDCGQVLVIGGDLGGAGAVQMAAMAALRVGAGKVWVATHPDHAALCDAHCLEPIIIGVASPEKLDTVLPQVDAILVGPGLGEGEWGKNLIEWALKVGIPLVVDADGLNYLAKNPRHQENWILTPHPGEAARLLNNTTKEIQENRLEQVGALQKKFGGVCLLKGAGTLIQATNESWPTICPYGNPGMATAGMGDVLAGMIVGLCAQKLSLKTAAELGVYLHALTGDLAANELGEHSLCATDLLTYVGVIMNEFGQVDDEGSDDDESLDG